MVQPETIITLQLSQQTLSTWSFVKKKRKHFLWISVKLVFLLTSKLIIQKKKIAKLAWMADIDLFSKKNVSAAFNIELGFLPNISKGLSRLPINFLQSIATSVLNWNIKEFPSYHILSSSMSCFCSILWIKKIPKKKSSLMFSFIILVNNFFRSI